MYKGKDSRIDVTGISELALLAELHNRAKVSDDGVDPGDIDMQEAAAGYTSEAPHFPEFLFGRPIKAFLEYTDSKTFLIRCDLYDCSAGVGVALDAINAARKYRETVI